MSRWTAAAVASRLARFDRLIAIYTTRVSSLGATPASTPQEKRAVTMASRALARHTRDRERFLEHLAMGKVSGGGEATPYQFSVG